MSLEIASTIEQLNSQWPLGTDSIARGDEHIRLIKSMLKAQFPGSAGNGFNVPVTATETELNYLTGATSNIQQQLDSLKTQSTTALTTLYAPKGTKMVFYQPAPPLGWTQDTAVNDKFLRVVNTAGATTGGTGGTSYSQKITPVINGHALTKTEMPAHTHLSNAIVSGQHSVSIPLHNANRYTWTKELGWEHHQWQAYPENGIPETTSTGDGAAHTHTANEFTASWQPSYANIIIAVKD